MKKNIVTGLYEFNINDVTHVVIDFKESITDSLTSLTINYYYLKTRNIELLNQTIVGDYYYFFNLFLDFSSTKIIRIDDVIT